MLTVAQAQKIRVEGCNVRAQLPTTCTLRAPQHPKQKQHRARLGLQTGRSFRVQVPGPDTGGWVMILQRFRAFTPGGGDHWRPFSIDTLLFRALYLSTKPGDLPGCSAKASPCDRSRGPGLAGTSQLITSAHSAEKSTAAAAVRDSIRVTS